MEDELRLILKYFPVLSELQQQQLLKLGPLYREWNQKINLISRKDIDNLYAHHILHSLAIAKVLQFKAGAEILDLGSGGGFPGIPLAVYFPETHFTLIDGTRKKIMAAEGIRDALPLSNVTALHVRAEEFKARFDFVLARAVAGIDQVYRWSQPLLKRRQQHALPNGLILLKGGDIQKEIAALTKGNYTEVFPLSDFFKEPYYTEKYAVYVQG